MLKKILLVGAVVALTGCATHQQSNELAGAAVGGIIGNAVGGRGGAVLGAGLGAMIGHQQPTQREPQVIIERQIVQGGIVESCRPRYHRDITQCEEKNLRDPNYTQQMFNACVAQAKYRYQNCIRDIRLN
jgi:osmotically inducible lipoprotein OsmB